MDISGTIMASKNRLRPHVRIKRNAKPVGRKLQTDWTWDADGTRPSSRPHKVRKSFRVSKDPVASSQASPSKQDSVRVEWDNTDVHSVRQRRIVAKIWADLDELERAITDGGFFDALDKMLRDAEREIERVRRYKIHRKANAEKAHRVLARLNKVRAIDLFKLTQHLTPDFFGEKHIQFAMVKELYLKKDRLVWHLTGLYIYLLSGVRTNKWSHRRGLGYAKQRKFYMEKLLLTHLENLRQKKWDRKRSKVRQRRHKPTEVKLDKAQETLYALRRGMDNNIPVETPLLDPAWDKDTIWDD